MWKTQSQSLLCDKQVFFEQQALDRRKTQSPTPIGDHRVFPVLDADGM